MQTKKPTQQQHRFNEFLIQFTHAATFAPLVYPLLTVDTTAVRNLQLINQQTAQNQSEQAQILHYKSGQLLNTFEDVQSQYQRLAQVMHSFQKVNKIKHVTYEQQQKPVLKKPILDKQPDKQKKQLQTKEINDQNVDLSNLQHLKQNKSKPKQERAQKPVNINIELRQIIRPEYRRQQQRKQKMQTHHQNENKFETKNLGIYQKSHRNPPNHKVYQSSEEYEDIPPVCMRKKRSLNHSKVSDRSVSPKIERGRQVGKSNLNNVSQISRNYQSGSDISFQIDLNSMGIFPKAEITKTSRVHKNKHMEQNKRKENVFHRTSRSKSKPTEEQIQEQEPWECDEEEIQEEIKKIDQRLSHRAYRTHRVQTEIQRQSDYFDQKNYKQSRVQKKDIYVYQPKIRQPKTVRLSLTPQKNKNSNNNQNKKVEMRKVAILTKDQSLNPQKQYIEIKKSRKLLQNKPKYELKTQIDRQFDHQDVIYSKWNKPKRAAIEVDIRRYAQ